MPSSLRYFQIFRQPICRKLYVQRVARVWQRVEKVMVTRRISHTRLENLLVAEGYQKVVVNRRVNHAGDLLSQMVFASRVAIET